MSDDQVQRAVDAMEQHTGTVPGYRRAHPRGIHFHAVFTPTAEAGELTTAEHFQGPDVPALVRLSNASGSPYAPDRRSAHRGVTLGLALRFQLASGGVSAWAAANLPNFPARTPEEFIRITELQNAATGRPSPQILAHLATHRHILPGVRGIGSLTPPASFANVRFNGLHAYYLVAPDGTRRAFRYSWEPDAGTQDISAEDARYWPPQYLISEIKQREEASWSLVFTLAAPGDPVDDVTQQWPKDRERITAGTLRLGELHEDQASVENLVFDPGNVPPGIELSDDPVLHFRSAVYSESYTRRSQEQRPRIRPE
ncbi:catalase [Streptacidiphilus sp. PAMC 29251]